MRKLSNYQKEFLLTHFFKNGNVAGWKEIATKLLETGECIVAGVDKLHNHIWIGDVGNFIKTEVAENAINCTLYKFDLENFISSQYYKDISNQYISILLDKKTKINQEYKEVSSLKISN